MVQELIHRRRGFTFGTNEITKIGESELNTGINFGILRLSAGSEQILSSHYESAYLLMTGKVIFYYDDKSYVAERSSIFDEDPIVLHAASKNQVRVMVLADCEFAVPQVANSKQFDTKIYDTTNMIESEKRGFGILDNTSYRIVRTIFDDRNTKESDLVLGEVVVLPGRWSSYPPHHHPQPEIYHYRFTEPQGYGIGQLGDRFFKVQQYDTVKILDNNDHAQVVAPGYGMYYIWVIRHLPHNRYKTPEYTTEHEWTKNESANKRVWQPVR